MSFRVLVAFVISLTSFSLVCAQSGFSHEIGIISGPVAFQSDYGERYDWDTNSTNVGIGVGIVHYLNFAYRANCNCYTTDTYFSDHFKVRTQINYHVTSLEHPSELAERNSLGGLQLRSMTGKARVFEIGSHLEWFPFSIRRFQDGDTKFAPYFAVGAHYVNFRPEVESELGPLNNSVTTYPTFLNRIDTSQSSTIAFVGDVGVRYKLNYSSDLLLSSAWHYYNEDYVDGLSPNNVNNKHNDWIWWLNIGFIYYL